MDICLEMDISIQHLSLHNWNTIFRYVSKKFCRFVLSTSKLPLSSYSCSGLESLVVELKPPVVIVQIVIAQHVAFSNRFPVEKVIFMILLLILSIIGIFHNKIISCNCCMKRCLFFQLLSCKNSINKKFSTTIQFIWLKFTFPDIERA